MDESAIAEIAEIATLMHETFRVPVHYLSASGDTLYESPAFHRANPFYSSWEELLRLCGHEGNISSPLPRLAVTPYLEQFVFMNDIQEGRCLGMYIVGPLLQARLTDAHMKGLVKDQSGIIGQTAVLMYYQSLRGMSEESLQRASLMLHYLVYGVRLSYEELLSANRQPSAAVEIDEPLLAFSKVRENISFHHDPVIELRLFDCVRRGQPDALAEHQQAMAEEQVGVLSRSSYLRSQKNLFIAVVTLATRAAIQGGLHSEIAFTLSDLYIQRVEDLTEPSTIRELSNDALYTFASRVKEAHNNRYSRAVTLCINYIFNHLYEAITLDKLAHLTGLHPTYVSALFKQEVGVPLSRYIQNVRIEEAKNLLALTNYSITKIYTLLSFPDQSYFTRVFKQLTGMTPKKFRDSRQFEPGITGPEPSASRVQAPDPPADIS
ncbi:hypothetical protein DNH61_01425 [Paenibacillus sambharensis]|uniref:HTH araC/xylS-type domain-containing protein n=1 Tax=Paenibacillus sambharensis TaxID=1803190 RepID=A0A2W1LFT4_9BACL|nr:helix-turn-helix domain-containing protein [Paenibacillus sambharensis]PZD97559.1 hypothetical protein DNH61_01425 [Paenibacillus sambharensis]